VQSVTELEIADLGIEVVWITSRISKKHIIYTILWLIFVDCIFTDMLVQKFYHFNILQSAAAEN